MHSLDALVAMMGIGGWVYLRGLRYRNGTSRRADPEPPVPIGREHELQREVFDLRDRIKVLERIATDANSPQVRQTRALSDEIESLRDR